MKKKVAGARPLLTVCIPTYEMADSGQAFLQHSLDILTKQTYKDFEVVISDHSKNEKIKNVCQKYENRLTIRYFRYTEHRGSSSANLNNALQKARGWLIKILFQDDFLYSTRSLEEVV